jgi:hypothetical protein
MKLFFINLQFLPINNNVNELTEKQYIDLIYDITNIKSCEGFIGRDKYIVFDNSSIVKNNKFVKGDILIFKKPPPYKDIKTNNITTKPKDNEVQYSKRVKFYFYAKKHILIIQKKVNELDRNSNIESKINKLFGERYIKIKENNFLFLNYRLDINVISKKEDLEKVINRKDIKSIEINITYPNSDDLEDDLENELKSKKTHILQHTEKSYIGTYMNGVTDYAKKLSHLALKLGNVIMSYIDDENKVKRYVMKDKIVERDISEKYGDKNLFEDEYIEDEVISVLSELKNENYKIY